ncbi:MAG: hypothetical protein V9G24_19480 [Rhodoblastus sp.]
MEEQTATITVATSARAVVGDGLSHVNGQRQPIASIALAGHDKLTRPPVDVINTERSHLACPQPQPGQHSQDREVATPRTGPPVTARQELGDLC